MFNFELCCRKIYIYPKLIKIDVEGFNDQVLEKGEKLLSNPTLRALIIETFRNGVAKEKIFYKV